MIPTSRKICLLFVLLLLCGCKRTSVKKVAKNATKKADTKKVAGLTSEMLVGTWKGVCFPSNGNYAQLTFRMTKSNWDMDYIVYGNKDCSKKAKFLAVNIKGPYTLGKKSKAGTNAREGKFSFGKKTVTAAQKGAVGFLKKTCKFKEVKVGEAIDLANGCAGLGAYPLASCAQDYDIVMVKGGLLHFGKRPKDNNMCTPEKRPSTFKGGAAVKKQ